MKSIFGRFVSIRSSLGLALFIVNTSYAVEPRLQNYENKEEEIGFLVMGDAGTGSRSQYRVAAGMETFCKQQKCDFLSYVGDNFYPAGVKSVDDPQFQTAFEKAYAALLFPFYVVLGNHDYQGNTDAQVAYTQKSKKWKMPEKYYQLESSFLNLIGIDTNRFDEKQINWLNEKLEKSTSKWNIVFGHHPVRSNGLHGDTPKMVDDLLPILQKRKVQMYLSGHDHNKEVIKAKNEPVFVVSGAGAAARPMDEGDDTVCAKATLGFTHVLLSTEKVKIQILDQTGAVECVFESKREAL